MSEQCANAACPNHKPQPDAIESADEFARRVVTQVTTFQEPRALAVNTSLIEQRDAAIRADERARVISEMIDQGYAWHRVGCPRRRSGRYDCRCGFDGVLALATERDEGESHD